MSIPMIADEPLQKPAEGATDETTPVVTPSPDGPAEGKGIPPSSEAVPTPALARFHSCRWRAQPEDGAYCTHRDVLPMAGKTGFSADSWCPDCQYFKVRRAPRKREY
jgi:hypothetical protein